MKSKIEVFCTYCKTTKADLVTGDVVYPHRADLAALYFWLCPDCGAFVGTHKNSEEHKPLGTLADKATRNARKRAHAVFDPMWKDGHMGSRVSAYAWLQDVLGLSKQACHISKFDEETCARVTQEVVRWMQERRTTT